MRQRRFPTAATTLLAASLLLVTLLATPVAAAEGRVILGSTATHPQVVTDPPAGECVSFTPFFGSAVDNLTNANVSLYGSTGCGGDPITVLAPGESRIIADSTEIGALMAEG